MKDKMIRVIVFFMFMIIPTVSYWIAYPYIDHENHENREYAGFPVFKETGYSGMAAGLEDYYNDRVPYKNQLKGIRTRIDTKLQAYESRFAWTSMTPMALTGKDGWIFYMPGQPAEDAVRDYQGLNLYTEEELEAYAVKYQRLSDYYKERNIDFVFIIVPGKENVYTEYMPDYYPKRANITRSEQFVEYLRQHTTVNAVYPRDYMRENAGICDLYYKKDSHWNAAGAYLGAKSVMDLLGDNTMPSLEEAEPYVDGTSAGGDLSNILGITGAEADDDTITLPGFYGKTKVTQINDKYSISDSDDARKVIVLGDSFGWRLFKILENVVSEVKYTSNTSDVKESVGSDTWKPDVIIWEVAERFNDRMDWPDILMNSDMQDQESEGSFAK